VNDELISPGAYLQKLVAQQSREVAKRRNDAGYIALWPQTVREVLAAVITESGDTA